jgi:hypothetical protein
MLVRIEYRKRTLAVALDRVQGPIRADQQLRPGLAMLRIERNANARADMHPCFGQHERARQGLDDTARQRTDVVGMRSAIGNSDKLITSEPSDQTAGWQYFTQPDRRFLQDLIAGGMAEAVIDCLEAVEIDQ